MGALKELASRIKSLGDIPDKVGTEVAVKLKAEAEGAFSSGSDPYGQAWAPNADGSSSHLYRTGTYRGSLRSQYGTDGKVYLKLGPLANIHQNEGITKKRPARLVLPNMLRPLPERWEKVIFETAENAVGKVMK